MRVRALDANGDMQFGRGAANFLVNSSAAVAQNIDTRLGLWLGEWFADTSAGTDWGGEILGKSSQVTRDMVLRQRILETEDVAALNDYSSSLDTNRLLSVSGIVMTSFGEATFDAAAFRPPSSGGQLDFSDPNNSGLIGTL